MQPRVEAAVCLCVRRAGTRRGLLVSIDEKSARLMTILIALSFGGFRPLFPGWEAVVCWYLAGLWIGGLWVCCDHVLRGRASPVDWDTLCYSFPTGVTFSLAVLGWYLDSPLGRSRGVAFEVFSELFFLLNLPVLAIWLLFVCSSLGVSLVWALSFIVPLPWSLALVCGAAFWVTWLGILRRLEERWTYRILSIRP